MKDILLVNAKENLGEVVRLRGWVVNIRSSGKIIFIQFRDGTGTTQVVVVKSEVTNDDFEVAKNLTIESSIILEGIVKEEPRSPSGTEMLASKIILVNLSPEYPIGKKEHGPSFLLDNRHLWLRSPRQQAIQIIRNEIIYAIYEYYAQENFIKIDTPILTPNACEGTTTLFEVDYFGEPSYLSQSGQLYLESAIFSVGRCFDFAPVFRAEKSKTRRHLIEFWMTDAEAAFVEHEENLVLQENLITFIVKKVLDKCQTQLTELERNTDKLKKVKAPFVRITHEEAMQIVRKLGSKTPPDSDLGNEDETLLMNHYETPIFVQYYPAKVKAFYMKRHPEKNDLALCADVLAPEGYGEIIGGSQREDDYETLIHSIKAHDLPAKEFEWYTDLRKYGSVPHSGFGLGLERIVAWICGLKHVRETIPYPRLINRMRP